jgi:hypothetical protein
MRTSQVSRAAVTDIHGSSHAMMALMHAFSRTQLLWASLTSAVFTSLRVPAGMQEFLQFGSLVQRQD